MKTKLTSKLQEEIIKNVKKGFYVKESVKAVGISEKTYYNWLQYGVIALRLKEKGEKVPKDKKIFLQFLQSVQQANTIGELEIYSEIRNHVKKDWRAGMEILSRKYPQRWAKQDKLEIKSKKTVLTKQIIEFRKEEKKLTEDDRKQLVEFTMKAIEEYAGSNGND